MMTAHKQKEMGRRKEGELRERKQVTKKKQWTEFKPYVIHQETLRMVLGLTLKTKHTDKASEDTWHMQK